jgi:hypothetical protein
MGHTRQINTKPASGYQTCQEPLEENDNRIRGSPRNLAIPFVVPQVPQQ